MRGLISAFVIHLFENDISYHFNILASLSSQSVHMRGLISAFVIHLFENVISYHFNILASLSS